MKVSQLIGSRKHVFSIIEDTSVHEAAQYLREKQLRSLGVVSQSDISDKVAAENKCPAWMKVSDIMTRDLICVTPETTIEDCLRLMDQHGIYHLLVLDEKHVYHGMVSVTDLLKVIALDEKARADLLEAFIFPQR